MMSLEWKKKRRSELLISYTTPPLRLLCKKTKIRESIRSIQFRILSKTSSYRAVRDKKAVEGDIYTKIKATRFFEEVAIISMILACFAPEA